MADIHFVILFNGASNDDTVVTNIVKMRNGLKKIDTQFVIYRDGIGNDKQWRWYLPRLFTEITGYGGGWIMHQAYLELRKNLTQAIVNGKIKTGDTLHFSVGGFSRGAALARDFATRLKQKISHELQSNFKLAVNVRLDCEYLFDTVPSFSPPINIWILEKLFDIRNPIIDLGWNFEIPAGTKAYHAVATDERRNAFSPNLVNFKTGETEEIWFDGDHSSIGGGHAPPTKETYMSDENTLRYMVRCAMRNGLQFEKTFLQKLRLSATDNPLGMIKAPSYDELSSTQRAPRTIMVKENNKSSQCVPKIAESVLERMKIDLTYRPENIKNLQTFDVVKKNGDIETYSASKVKKFWQELTQNKVLSFRSTNSHKAKSASQAKSSTNTASKKRRMIVLRA